MVSTESATRKDFDADQTNKTPSKDRKAAAAAGGSSPPGSSSSTIAPYYQKVLAKYPVLLRHTKAKGRHAAASRNLDQGVTVCQEQATAFVVRSEYIDQQCHVCLESLAAAKRAMMCQDCKKAFYCSNACLERDTGVHRLICTALAQVDAIGRATDVDPDLLRLILLLLARRQLEMDQDAMLEGTPFWCVNDLVSHRDRANPAFVAVVKDAARRLLSELPESMQIPVDEVVTLACRINSNAHGLGDNESRNTDVAFGLFPVGAMFFNHACNPNCAFVGLVGGQLAFRTIRPVQRDEELTVSYIDLYASRDERRHDLLGTKHFWCKCKRCTTPMHASVDRYLQSIVCENCCDDVYVIPPTPLEDLSRGLSNQAKDSQDIQWQCAKCGHAASAAFVAATLRQAHALYEDGIKAIRLERNYKRARQKFEPLIAKVVNHNKQLKMPAELHPQNAVRLNASIPLMNCLRHEQDIAAAIDVNRFIIRVLEEHAKLDLPRNTAEISDFWLNLGELCDIMANHCRAAGQRTLEKRWFREAREAFQNAAQVRAVVFGPDHPKTKYAQRHVSQMSSF